MKALTIRQPWATLIALGVKTIETRPYPTKVRGRIAIHAGAKAPRWVGGSQHGIHDYLPWVWVDGAEYRWDGPLGAIVATADLCDCVPIIDAEDPDDPCGEMVTAFIASQGSVTPPDSAWFYDSGTDEIGYGLGDQLPYGDFTPGRWAWLLRDVQPTTERCPACWGDGTVRVSPPIPGVCAGPSCGCTICDGTGRCGPIPAKGRPGWWEWTP